MKYKLLMRAKRDREKSGYGEYVVNINNYAKEAVKYTQNFVN